MTGPGGHGSARPGDQEPVGSVGEEAARLLAVLQEWAREHTADYSRAAGTFGSAYISDGSAACKVCPVCQAIAFVRGVNPEALDQLTRAAGSMLQALSALVEGAHRPDHPERGSPVQKIDLSDDEPPADPEEPSWP